MRGAHWIAEQRIADAQRRGEFEHLPNHGKPLPDDALAGLDEEARTDIAIQRALGAGSLEVTLMKELADKRAELAAMAHDDADRPHLQKRVRELAVRLSVVHESNGRRLLAHPERVRLP